MSRILFLLTQDLESPYGVGRYYPMARELARNGHQVFIAALHPDYDCLPQRHLERDNIRIHYVAPMHVRKRGSQKEYYSSFQLIFKAIWSTLRLTWEVLNTPADVLLVGKPHPMNSIPGLVGKVLLKRRIILDCDDDEVASNRFTSPWQRRVIRYFQETVPHWSDLTITNTHYMREKLIAYGVSEDRICYIPNGVDPERFPNIGKDEIEAEKHRLKLDGLKIVAYIGSMSLTNHAVDLLVEAFAQVHTEIPQTALILVGGGEDLERIKAMVVEKGLADAVRFLGRVPPEKVNLYYRMADVSVDPVYDNDAARGRSPLKMFESWVTGVPFVTADVGDRRILAGENPAARIVQSDCPGLLAREIVMVLSDEFLRRSLVTLGGSRVKEFHWGNLASLLPNMILR